jgi:heme/copper-type cytochrome/quinol oxidase subunit 3
VSQSDNSIGFAVGVAFFVEILFVYSSWDSSGMSPGTALGFFWALTGVHRKHLSAITPLTTSAAAAERKELYRFSVDLGKLALRIAECHGTNSDRWYAPTS